MGKYEQIIEWVFNKNYQSNKLRIPFNREEEKHYQLIPRTAIVDTELRMLAESEL